MKIGDEMKKIELSRKNSFVRFGSENFAVFNPQTILSAKILADVEHTSTQYFLEMALPLHVGAYALLGYIFEPLNSDCLIVEVLINDNKQIFQDSLLYNKESVYFGLNEEYGNLILDGIVNYFKDKKVPKGKLKICMGAYSEVYSSSIAFKIVLKIIMDIFTSNKELTEKDVINICEENIQIRYRG